MAITDAQIDAIFQSRIKELRRYAVPCTVGRPGVVVINRHSSEKDFQSALAKAKEWKAEYDDTLRANAAAEAKAKAETEGEEGRRRLGPDGEVTDCFH